MRSYEATVSGVVLGLLGWRKNYALTSAQREQVGGSCLEWIVTEIHYKRDSSFSRDELILFAARELFSRARRSAGEDP